ncbi:hypothetical protein LTR09_001641 [Extremus antarcticus]|uniref:DJ-1/PfpI domain-containing protein n=1 Tax=Extremus antarcticus TaxID=702011 RepID=A0AAJ0GH42_9PEZI|nr:hypothetical protein LTR09_001641 [Extremus antarcticus]
MADKQDDKDVPQSYGLLLFPQFEVLDAAGPIEVLNVLSNYFVDSKINLSVITPNKDLVSPGVGQNFLGNQLYKPTHSLDDAPPLDVLIIPGGRGTTGTNEELRHLLDFIRDRFNGASGHAPLKYVFSICTGSDLLARAGVLDDRRATTNKRAWTRVTPDGPKTHWVANARWVESGRVWTTSGVTAGIDGMAALVGKIYGEEVAQKHVRVTDPSNDPFAEQNGCKDVLPLRNT